MFNVDEKRPNDNDLELFDAIVDWIRKNQELFVDVGSFLDKNYSNEMIALRDDKLHRAYASLGCRLSEPRKPSKLTKFCQVSADLLEQMAEISPPRKKQPAWSKALGLQKSQSCFRDMRAEDRTRIAKLILLLTWLAHDSDADRVDFRITTLQDWSWGDGEVMHAEDSVGQTAMPQDASFHRRWARAMLFNANSEAWCELVHQAWAQVTGFKFSCQQSTNAAFEVHQRPVVDWKVENLAEHLDITAKQVRERCRKKMIPCQRAYKIGRAWRIPADDYEVQGPK